MQKPPKLEKKFSFDDFEMIAPWSGAALHFIKAPFHNDLSRLLSLARSSHGIEIGFENIAEYLERERVGLDKAQGLTQEMRVSRIVIVTEDASERLLRHCETLINKHGSRTIGILLKETSIALGSVLHPKKKGVKVALVSRKGLALQVLDLLREHPS